MWANAKAFCVSGRFCVFLVEDFIQNTFNRLGECLLLCTPAFCSGFEGWRVITGDLFKFYHNFNTDIVAKLQEAK